MTNFSLSAAALKKSLSGGVKLRDVAELRVTLLQHEIEGERAKTAKVVLELFGDHRHACGGVVLGSASGFEQNIVDAAEEFDVAGGVFESGGGLLFPAGVFPHDGGAALGGDDRVDGVLEHEDAVGDRQRQCSSRSAFDGDSGDGGYAETGHFDQVAGDGFALASLFGSDAGVGTGEVDEGEDGAGEFFCDL